MASFARNILRLGVGNLVAQAISLAAVPVITRLYSPEQFGIFSIYFSATMLLYPASTLQFHAALMLPKEDAQASNLLLLSVLSVVGVSLGLVPLVLLVCQLSGVSDFKGLGGYVWLIPLGVFIQGVGEAVDFWSLRRKVYGAMAWSRIGSALGDRSIAIGGGLWAGAGAVALIVGRLVGPLIAATVLARVSIKPIIGEIRSAISVSGLRSQAARYRSFPVFSTWATLLQSAANEMPVLLLAVLFSPLVAGFYGLTVRVVRLPAMLVADAVGRAYFQRASERHAHGKPLATETVELFGYMLYLELFPALVLAYFGPNLFAAIFGDRWAESGAYVQILIVVFMGIFLNRVVAVLFDVMEKQRQRLVYDVAVFGARAVALVVGAYLGGSPRSALIGLAVASAIGYVGGWIYLFGLVQVTATRLFRILTGHALKMMPLAVALGLVKVFCNEGAICQIAAVSAALVAQGLFLLAVDDMLKNKVMSALVRR